MNFENPFPEYHRFPSPKEITLWAIGAAGRDYKHYGQNNVSYNPYSTYGSRHLWERGYYHQDLLNYQGDPLWNTMYNRGRAARLVEILNENIPY
jgi:hypothetical protein